MPAYGAIVARPMDLGTIGARLADGTYHADGAAAFAADVRLVHANAAVFCETSPNGADAVVYRMAQVLRAAFEHRWLQLLGHTKVRGDDAKRRALASFAPPQSRADGAAAGESGGGSAALDALPAAPEAGHGGGDVAKDPTALVHHRIEVFWPRDKAWYAASVAAFRKRDGRHRVDYDDGHVEWLELANPRNKYRLLGSSKGGDAASGAGGTNRKAPGADDVISVQKLGIVVWGKSGAHPWWPAELCLPAATKFLDALPPPRDYSKKGSQTNRQKMVIYFGDT